MSKGTDKWIVEHSEALKRMITILMLLWYFGGIVAIDYLNPVLFLVIWIPTGIAAAAFAKLW